MVLGRVKKLGKSATFWIFLLALLLRTVNLGNIPAGFTPDEASFGYDAYSILKTGKDQWGHTFPVVLESFGDFKAPLYSYLLIPFIALFGLTEFAVRLPNALMGTGAVMVTFYLMKEMGELGIFGKLKIGNWKLGIMASAILALSPWHIMMSRGGFEANLTTFLLPFGILGFLKTLNTKSKHKDKWLVVSSVSFGLNLFSYHSAKIITPLIFLFLLLIFRKRFKELPKKLIYRYLSIFAVFIVVTLYTFTKGAGARVSDVSVFSGAAEAAAQPRLDTINSGVNPFIAKVLHNKYQITAIRFMNNYKQYYSYKFLFKDGPAEATYGMIPGRGVLHPIEMTLIVGFLASILWNRKQKGYWLIIFWLLIAPIPAALSTGPGYAGNRSVIMLPAMQIALSFGAGFILFVLRKRSYKILSVIIFFSLLLVSLFGFLYEYHFVSPYKSADAMLYGRKDAMNYLKNIETKYDNIVISRTLSEPHIYVAFYLKWDPADYQNESKDWQRYKENNLKFLDQLGEYHLGKYVFTHLENEKYVGREKTLFVGKPEEFGEGEIPRYIIKYPNGEDAIYIVDPEDNALANFQFLISN